MTATDVPLVRDLPFRPLVTIEPEASLRIAARTMRQEGVSALVVGTPGALVTILTERDVTAAVADGRAPDTLTAELATPRPATVDRDATVVAAAARMLDEGVRHLVVVQGGRAVGVVSIRDLLAVLLQAFPPEGVLLLVGGFGERVRWPR
ncbi:MAG TPA: CBS domain-containing protein [Acidimicrobiales bacterium]|nr:CBS domain-containing protein [Acidimicrobiales bacterium]